MIANGTNVISATSFVINILKMKHIPNVYYNNNVLCDAKVKMTFYRNNSVLLKK